MRGAWISLALSLACSRENPGFMLAGPGGSEPSTGAVTTGSTTGESTTTTSTSTSSTTEIATTGEPLPACPLWPEPGLDWKFTYKGAPLTPGNNCQPESFRGAGMLAPTSVQLGPDTDKLACGATIAGILDFTVGAFQFPPFLESCLEIEVAWDSTCTSVSSALLWYYNPGLPDVKVLLAAGVVGSQSAHPNTPKELMPTLVLTEACSCGAATKECCMTEGIPGPGEYRLRFESADLEIGPGESTPTDTPIVTSSGKFAATNLRTHIHPNCAETPLHADWYALPN
jgi:hypothetical protein